MVHGWALRCARTCVPGRGVHSHTGAACLLSLFIFAVVSVALAPDHASSPDEVLAQVDSLRLANQLDAALAITDPSSATVLAWQREHAECSDSLSYLRFLAVTGCEVDLLVLPTQCEPSAPVLVDALEAIPSEKGVLIRWQATPHFFEAFYVERRFADRMTEYVSLNPHRPIPGSGPWEFHDSGARLGESYKYRLMGMSRSGVEGIFGPVSTSMPPVTREAFRGVFPNPAQDRARIDFDLSVGAELTIRVHDLTGRPVATAVQGRYEEGPHSVSWNGCDEGGVRLASGVYFATRETAEGPVGHSTIVLRR